METTEAPRPLLMLTMIVKDEAHTLHRTLRSVRPFIDAYTILDTGSTDGTQDVIRRELADIPGVVFEEPFVDFATTRNRGLDLCGGAAEYVIWLDADDVLQGGEHLREFLAAERAKKSRPSAYHVQVRLGGAVFDSPRVVTHDSEFRFVGVVHEVLCHSDGRVAAPRIPGTEIVHETSIDGAARSRARWERDVGVLSAELFRDPSSTRSAFYLGLTLRWLGRHEEAMSVLRLRITMGGWPEEVYYSRLCIARCASDLGRSWPEVLALYLEAYSHSPQRAEALFDIAMHYHELDDHVLTLLFARRAFELPAPKQDMLFVESSIHEHMAADLVATHAYWVGEFELGEAAARQAVHALPDDPRLTMNLKFYEARHTAQCQAAG